MVKVINNKEYHEDNVDDIKSNNNGNDKGN